MAVIPIILIIGSFQHQIINKLINYYSAADIFLLYSKSPDFLLLEQIPKAKNPLHHQQIS